MEIGRAAAFDLALVAPSLPPFPCPSGHTEMSYLRHLVEDGATRRYGPRPRDTRDSLAWRTIDHELDIIETLGFPQMADRTPDPLRLMVTAAQSAMVAPRGMKESKETQTDVDEAILADMEQLYNESQKADNSAQKARVTAFTQSIAALARMMDAVEGRKYVVYLSEGFDTSLAQGSQEQNVQDQQSDAAGFIRLFSLPNRVRALKDQEMAAADPSVVALPKNEEAAPAPEKPELAIA